MVGGGDSDRNGHHSDYLARDVWHSGDRGAVRFVCHVRISAPVGAGEFWLGFGDSLVGKMLDLQRLNVVHYWYIYSQLQTRRKIWRNFL